MKLIKKVLFLSPLLLFAVLFVPYNFINQRFIVKWLGCGCPVVDEFGNTITNTFNANDFTAIFWSFIALCVNIITVLLSKKISKEKSRYKGLYVCGMFLVSSLITYKFTQLMMWN